MVSAFDSPGSRRRQHEKARWIIGAGKSVQCNVKDKCHHKKQGKSQVNKDGQHGTLFQVIRLIVIFCYYTLRRREISGHRGSAQEETHKASQGKTGK
jgi:hypothetical protein